MLNDIILKRRSIRKFSKEKVPKDVINEIINSARFAPSGCNAQPSRYLIVESDRALLLLKKNNVFFQDWIYKAPVIIVCCGDSLAYKSSEGYQRQINDKTLPKNSQMIIGEIYSKRLRERTIRDVSIASTYLVLKATELRLGTCYIGLFDENNLKKTLQINKEYVVPFCIALGYSDKEVNTTTRKPLEEIILSLTIH